MQHTKIFQKFSNAWVGIEQFDGPVAWVLLRLGHTQAKSRQHAQKGAVHQDALGEIQHEIPVSFLPQIIKQGLEINARMEIGPPNDLDTAKFLSHEYQHF